MRVTPWSDRLALDLALMLEGSGEDVKDVLKRHEITQVDLIEYSGDPVFQTRVEAYRKDVRENGLTFKLKARAQAEELLQTSWVLIHDTSVSPAVRADLIKSTVKWAGLEPKGPEVATDGNKGVSITINLGGKPAEMRVVESEVAEITETPLIGGQ